MNNALAAESYIVGKNKTAASWEVTVDPNSDVKGTKWPWSLMANIGILQKRHGIFKLHFVISRQFLTFNILESKMVLLLVCLIPVVSTHSKYGSYS